MAEVLHAAFERGLQRWAAHPADAPLKVWDAQSGKLKVQTAEGTTERSVGLGWGSGFLWSASRSGRLVLWSLARNSVAASLSLPTPAPFTAAVATDTDVFTAAEGQGVARWSLANKAFVQEVCATKEAVECMAVSRSGKSLLLAGTSIRLYSLAADHADDAAAASKKKRKAAESDAAAAGGPVRAVSVHKYKGHTAAVRALAFAAADETFFASAAAADRFVHVWRTTDASAAHATLACDAGVRAVDFSSHHSSPSLHLIAVTDSGLALLFHVPTAARAAKPLAARTTVRLASGPETVLAAAFASPSELLVVRGSPVRPVFERAVYLPAGDAPAEIILAPRAAPAAAAVEGDRRGPIETLWVAEASKIATPADGTATKRRKNKPAEAEADTRSLAEKLEAAGLQLTAEGGMADSAGAAPRADSVLHLLTQALHTRDAALLEVCLSQSDAGVVAATVARLGAAHVLPLLAALVQRLQGRPARAAQLVTWLRALLVAHTAYLLSVPDLARSLSPLFQALDARLAVFRKLLALSGRLDLLLSLRSTARLAAVAAPAVFDEREGGELSSEGEEEAEEAEEEEEEADEGESGEESEGGEDESSGLIDGLEEGDADMGDADAADDAPSAEAEAEEAEEEEAPPQKQSRSKRHGKQ